VVPAWNGLDLVRGEQEEHVARLGFLWTHDLSPIFWPSAANWSGMPIPNDTVGGWV
jgi:hypothetical protein